MARTKSRIVAAVAASAALACLMLNGHVFVPAPQNKMNRMAAALPAVAVLGAAPAAFADEIGDAAAKFSDATYPIAEKINWGNSPVIASYIATESAKNPQQVAKAVDKLLEAGLTMDPKLVYAAVAAHDKAIGSALNNKNLVASKADFAEVNEALARMIASSNSQKFFALLDAFPDNKDLQAKLYSLNNKAEAETAYKAFQELTKAVKAASTNGANGMAGSPVGSGGAIGDAAAKFSEATYPIAKSIDWSKTAEISRYIAEASANNPKGVAQAFDDVLKVGLSMDPKAVYAAVAAHDKAIDAAVSKKGFVASEADFAAVNEALARMIATADPAKFKAILTAFPGNAELQMALYAANDPAQAKAAFDSFKALTEAVAR